MRAPGTPSHGRAPSPADDRPDSHPISPSLPYPSPPTLAGCSKDRPRQRRSPWRPQAGTHWQPSHLVPSDGDLRGEKRHTEAHHRFSAPQCPSNKGDSPHPVPIPPSPFRPPRQTENRVRRLEWVPQRRPAPRRSSLHDIHHPVGPLQGYISSGDGYTRRYDEIVSDVPQKTKCVDDTLLWADTIEESFHQACNWLTLCGPHGITLNPLKFQFPSPSVEFAGFEITADSVKPCQKFTRAIKDFPTPKNLTDVRSWFGLVNQVAYAFSMTTTMLPFRDLLKPSQPFRWDEGLQHAFEESKLHDHPEGNRPWGSDF